MDNRKDIKSAADIELLVNDFYDSVRNDSVLSPVFLKRIPNAAAWPQHLRIMCNFWETVLFGNGNYRGNPFPKHLGLGIETMHFDRWINLFHKTVDHHFIGEKAEEAKDRAEKMRTLFEIKLNQSGENSFRHLV